jgi:hypothetical protein
VRIGFDELGDPWLLPDMGVKVSFRAEKPAEGEPTAAKLLVPAAAVRSQEGTEMVFVLRDGVVERRAVSLGGEAGDRREVLAGLRDGERVVLDPPPTLEDGDPVREE